ncbi:hypothetical protein BDV23DRAFT_166200, partial [Aspergillus alliaceus]
MKSGTFAYLAPFQAYRSAIHFFLFFLDRIHTELGPLRVFCFCFLRLFVLVSIGDVLCNVTLVISIIISSALSPYVDRTRIPSQVAAAIVHRSAKLILSCSTKQGNTQLEVLRTFGPAKFRRYGWQGTPHVYHFPSSRELVYLDDRGYRFWD